MRSAEQNSRASLCHAESVVELNDRLRTRGLGGLLVVTTGVRQLEQYEPRRLLEALRDYNDFNPENDPHGEHDFGKLELFGTTLFWKIDYFDLMFERASPDPANPDVTNRVLTIMRADEY